MSNRKVAFFVVFGAAAVTLAGYSAYAQRANRALRAEQAAQDFVEPQVANRAAKTGRLPLQTALSTIENEPVYALASASTDIGFGRPTNPAIAATPIIPDEPVAAPEPKQAAVAPAAPLPAPHPHDKPAEKPKHAAVTPPASSGVLDDGQINGLKGRLRLTSDQAEYWPAVEAALRDVVRTHLRGLKPTAKPSIDVNSPEVQKLIWAAVPLLMRLREDQKSEVRKLARVIGLEQVASQI